MMRSEGATVLEPTDRVSQREIFLAWMPLFTTWCLMALEGPILSALVARLSQPALNLAAYGVMLSIVLLFESPIFMVLSGATSLVSDKASYYTFRNFTLLLSLALTALLAGVLYPVPWDFLTVHILGLPDDIRHLAHIAGVIALPAPLLVGYRRLYQGIMIRYNLASRVFTCTCIRLFGMSSSGFLLFFYGEFHGVVVASLALMIGLACEATAARVGAQAIVRRIVQDDSPVDEVPLSYGSVLQFYTPLAATGVLAMTISPLITLILARSPDPIASLAVFPVLMSLSFLFKSAALASQEVIISKIGRGSENGFALRRFVQKLSLGATLCWAALAFTPLLEFWYGTICGLSPTLVSFAELPTQLLTPLPAIAVWLIWLRAQLISRRRTGSITVATLAELGMIAIVMLISIVSFDMSGLVAAALAQSAARFVACLILLPRVSRLERSD